MMITVVVTVIEVVLDNYYTVTNITVLLMIGNHDH